MSALTDLIPARRPPLLTSLTHGVALPVVYAIAIATLAQFAIGPALGEYWASVGVQVGIAVMLAVSLNIVNGFTGQFSIGHAGFFAIGAYVGAGISYYSALLIWGDPATLPHSAPLMWEGSPSGLFGAGDWIMVAGALLGGCVSAVFGYIVGLPSLRLRGDYLAIVTLGFGEIVRVLLQQTRPQVFEAQELRELAGADLFIPPLGGATGFSGIPKYATLWWVWFFVFFVVLFAYRVKLSSTGRALLSIREDEIASRAMGVNITKYKVRAFVLAAGLAGIAGALYAHSGNVLQPRDAGFQRSFECIIYVVLGGLGSISGAALAAVALSIMTEALRGPEPILENWPILVGLAIAGTIAAGVLRAIKNRGWRITFVLAMTPLSFLALGLASKLFNEVTGVNLAAYRMVVYALLLIVVMLARPNGLFGLTEIWEYFGPIRGPKPGSGNDDSRLAAEPPAPAPPAETQPSTPPTPPAPPTLPPGDAAP